MTFGPIDFIALEFQNDQLKGEIFPALLELVQNKTIRIIDLVVVGKREDGSHEARELHQLSPDLIAVFNPLNVEVSGLIQEEDIQGLLEVMDNGTTAAAMLFENLWAVNFKNAVIRANGRLLEQLRVPHEVVEEALARFKSAEENPESAALA
jgi:hypothetical protein